MSTTKLKAVGLIRLSTAEQAAEGRAGIDRQRNDIQVAARMHNVDVVRTVEVVESGTRVRGQRDFEQIFKDLKDGVVDGVCCSALDRLVRPDTFADYGVLDHFKLNRKRIFTPGGIIDPGSQNGFLESSMKAMFAGYERQQIAARTLAAKEELRKQGRHPQGGQMLPRGVRYDKKTYQWSYDGVDSERMRRAYQLLFAGHSYESIAQQIGGYRTGSGVRIALMNSIWCGIRTYPPTVDRKTPLERRVIPEAEALLTFKTWQKAQAIIAGRKKAWGARLRQPRFLAAGMLACSCGRHFYTKANSPGANRRRQEHYTCASRYPGKGPKCGSRSLQRKAVDAAVVKIVKDTLRDPALLLRMIELSERQRPAADTTQLKAALDKIEAKRARLVELYTDGDLTKEEYRKRSDVLTTERRSIEALLPVEAPALDARRLVKALATYFAGFEDRPFEQQRQILRTAFRQFTVQNEAVQSVTMDGGFLGSVDGAKVPTHSRAATRR